MLTTKQMSLLVQTAYKNMKANLSLVRSQLQKPLTLSEKILFSHVAQTKNFKESEEFLSLYPDRVIMQDATAQMAMLQFMLTGKDKVTVPTTIHCDHLIVAKDGLKKDMPAAVTSNKEVYDFLSSVASRYDIGFWKPGSGIIHQVFLENYAFPGGLIIGTDSHTPNAGGLGMLAIGVGGADATDVMAGFCWEIKKPKITGVHLTGSLSGWTSPKDIILKLLGILTVKGGTNKIIEYFGEGCDNISCTGKATITNMGAELGATCSVFPYDSKMNDYLSATYRENVAELADQNLELLTADKKVLENPQSYYHEVIEIDLDKLEPHISGPHSPDKVRPIKKLKEELKKESWPVKLSSALIGSCTNSSYEDIGRAAHVAEQAANQGFKMPQPFLVSPGSELVKKTIERDGFMDIFNKVGAVVLANACGPCIGQWQRGIKKGETNTIINSFNRNFRGRNDANPNTLSFIASPEITMAIGLSGRLDFNPETDELEQNGKKIKLQSPTAKQLPEKGFLIDKEGFIPPKGKQEPVQIKNNSERLANLTPFAPWDGKDFENLLVLCKARGKCTTDHISPAGYWLKYRGHIDKISDNLLLGATNDYTGEVGRAVNLLSGKTEGFATVARDYKSKHQSWIIIGDENYGEGSSREHAAMTPRHLGAAAVIAKSFARIHETNLKKQGVLAFVFIDKDDYIKIKQEDRVSILDLSNLKPKSKHSILLNHKDGTKEKILVAHSLNEDQIKWFQAGSCLNTLRS